VNKDSLKMFSPEPGTMREILFKALLGIFLTDEDAPTLRASFNSPAQTQAAPVPSFAEQLTLRLSVKIKIQEAPSGTCELNRTQSCTPDVEALLRGHILSMKLWDRGAVVLDNDCNRWEWTPPSGGRFKLCKISRSYIEGQVNWTGYANVVSILQIKAAAQ
jgi:hypothetical protein